MPEPSHHDDPRPIGKPATPFDTDEIRTIKVAPSPEPIASIPALPPGADGYDLEGVSFPEVEEPPQPVPIPIPSADRPKAKLRAKAREEAPSIDGTGSTEFVTEVSEVDPVWTRMGEWGLDLYRVIAAGRGNAGP